MGSVLVDMAISLDGYISGPNGEDWGLHDWYFTPPPQSQAVIDELVNGLGAIIMGRNMYSGDEEFGDNPYKMPHFVITHKVPDNLPAKSNYTFVTDGIESALRQAQAAAGDKPIAIGGGASIVRQFLEAGLVDEVQLHVVPALFGSGLRLFDAHLAERIQLEQTHLIESVGVTHLKYRVIK